MKYERIYDVVKKIPRSRVATYGQIARLAGIPNHARQIGYALAAMTQDDAPWHRVINAKGEISPRAVPGAENRQRYLLEKEKIKFDKSGRISLGRFQWKR